MLFSFLGLLNLFERVETHRQRQLEEVKILETLATQPHEHVLQFHEAWEEKEQLHIRTSLAECGDLETYLNAISETGGLGEARCWKMLFELTSVRHFCVALRPTFMTMACSPFLNTHTGFTPYTLVGHSASRPQTRQCAYHRARWSFDQRLWTVCD